ncbi:MAG: YbhB and YbcL [Candidatus Gottesmanbacteria bacterium GW2011_GWA2_43_14]|uniref:YbhB and YbcL n=1 Tax=Candidatus Gottesmanbacteria bacterium GW2011_GWA2_43_14 TaxID=1618443 RepID=A0A0G1DFC6_9BACT|nr:MAG: YbhB and YbcL [Candidatus Gottesmanbacteria bacterium GW2011_GWA2_43_14]
MIITSNAFSDSGVIPEKYTCEGTNISPPLEFNDLPAESKSLVLIVEDWDAAAKPWVHWLVFNIPPTTNSVTEGQKPQGGVEGLANGGTFGYEGPCPPQGNHHYQFKLYALDVVLKLPKEVDRRQILSAMQGKILAEAILSGFYHKKT